jgi:hypothetical protein
MAASENSSEHNLGSRGVAQELLRLDAHTTLLSKIYGLAIGQHEPSVRLMLLFGSILKLLRMTKAVQLLASEVFVEEIQAMNRTMAEVTVNAAYLQDAEDKEVARFQHFDIQSAFKHATRLRPHTTIKLPVTDLKKIEEVASDARLLTGRKDSDLSWSTRNLVQRAEYSDGVTHLNMMTLLVLSSYPQGHSAIHGTFAALEIFIESVGTMQVPLGGERKEGLFIALFGVNFTLSVMCFYLNSLFHLDLEKAIIHAGKLIA